MTYRSLGVATSTLYRVYLSTILDLLPLCCATLPYNSVYANYVVRGTGIGSSFAVKTITK